jgi:hypothetical protein
MSKEFAQIIAIITIMTMVILIVSILVVQPNKEQLVQIVTTMHRYYMFGVSGFTLGNVLTVLYKGND